MFQLFSKPTKLKKEYSTTIHLENGFIGFRAMASNMKNRITGNQTPPPTIVTVVSLSTLCEWNAVKIELMYREKTLTTNNCLRDTIETCLSIVTKGKTNKEHYSELMSGIRKIKSHVFQVQYSGEVASTDACKVLYLSACILKDVKFNLIEKYEKYQESVMLMDELSKGAYMRKIDIKAYSYLVEENKILIN